MQPWPPAPPPGQNYYELSSVFSANGLTPQVSYGAAKPHVPRYNINNPRPNIRNKRITHDHRPNNSIESNQPQNQNVNPSHRSMHSSTGNIHQQPHHVSNQPPIPNQHNIIHNQSQQSLGAVPIYKPATSIISHGNNSPKAADVYHYNSSKIPKENSFSISSNNQPPAERHVSAHYGEPSHQYHNK